MYKKGIIMKMLCSLLATLLVIGGIPAFAAEPMPTTSHRELSAEQVLSSPGAEFDYVCFALAKDILTGSRTVVLGELADPSLLSPRNFMVVSLAMFIRAYGLNAANQVTLNPHHAEGDVEEEL